VNVSCLSAAEGATSAQSMFIVTFCTGAWPC